jgi:hypothetical protein
MLRQLLLNYFQTQQTQTDVELVNAGQCHTLQWLTDLDESDPTQQDFIFQVVRDAATYKLSNASSFEGCEYVIQEFHDTGTASSGCR